MKVLLTGATGFLGRRLVQRLAREGYELRALVRKPSAAEPLKALGVEVASGDLIDSRSVSMAISGMDVVIHAAAGTSGSPEDAAATVEGARNVLESCRIHRVGKLIYLSSCNVYEVAGLADGDVVSEEAQLERFAHRRGHYTIGKLQAEALVTEAMRTGSYPTIVLRPGTLYGPGAALYTPMIGVSLGKRVFIVFGNGQAELPLVHVDNVVDAIVQCIASSAADNAIFNVVDQEPVTKRRYIEQLVRPLYPDALVFYLPIPILLTATWLQETLLALLGAHPRLTMYRVLSSQRQVRYSSAKIERTIGWRSRIGFDSGAAQILENPPTA